MTEEITPVQKLINFVDPFVDKYNENVDAERRGVATDEWRRRYINGTIANNWAIDWGISMFSLNSQKPMLGYLPEQVIQLVSVVRVLTWMEFTCPEELDAARDELIEIIKGLNPNFEPNLRLDEEPNV